MELNCEYYTDAKCENTGLANFNKYAINKRDVNIVCVCVCWLFCIINYKIILKLFNFIN